MSLEPRGVQPLNKGVGDQIHVTLTFEQAWETPGLTVIGSS